MRDGDPTPGARAVRVAADDSAGPGAPLSLRDLPTGVVPRHVCCDESRAKLSRAAVRLGPDQSDRSAPHGRAGGRSSRRSVARRQRHRHRGGSPGADRGPRQLLGRHHRRRRRAHVAPYPLRRQVRHRHHRSDPDPRGTGPARLLEMVEGRSKTWLAARPKIWRDGVEVVALDGFIDFKTATAEGLPDAIAVMDPFHVVRLAVDVLDRCRRRVQRTCTATAGARRIRSIVFDGLCTPAPTSSPTSRPPGSTRCSPSRSTLRARRPGASTSAYYRLAPPRPRPGPRSDDRGDRLCGQRGAQDPE